MADTGYLEFSYDEAEVNEITSYLTSTKNRLNEYNLSSVLYKFICIFIFDKKSDSRFVICTPKVRHFWRCIFLWKKQEE